MLKDMGFDELSREVWSIAYLRHAHSFSWRKSIPPNARLSAERAPQGVAFGDWAFGAAGRSIAINSETVANV